MSNEEYSEAKKKLYMLTAPKIIEDSKKPIKRTIKALAED